MLCDYWPDTVDTDTCVTDNLVLNEWETQETLATLTEPEKEALLKDYLNKYLDGSSHTLADLGFRDVAGGDVDH